MPHAVGVGWVRVWVVGAAEEAPWAGKEAPTGCRDGGERSEVKRRESFFFFFPQGASSCIPLSCYLGPFSRKISPECSPDWGARLTPASGCPLGVPVAWEVVVEVAGVVPVVARPPPRDRTCLP